MSDSLEIDGIRCFPLDIECPICSAGGRHTSKYLWYHDNCGGRILVGEDANLYCDKCGWEMHISIAKFRCPLCSIDGENYLVDTYKGRRANLSQLISPTANFSIDWLNNYILALRRNQKN